MNRLYRARNYDGLLVVPGKGVRYSGEVYFVSSLFRTTEGVYAAIYKQVDRLGTARNVSIDELGAL